MLTINPSTELVVISKEEYEMMLTQYMAPTDSTVFHMRLGLVRFKTPAQSFTEAVNQKAFAKVLPNTDHESYLDVVKELCNKISTEWLLDNNAYLRVTEYQHTPNGTRLELLLNDEVICNNIVPEHLTGEKGYMAYVLLTAVIKAQTHGFENGKKYSLRKLTELLSKTIQNV